MNNLIYLQQLSGFISKQFPTLALVSLLAISIILVFLEKRRRKLILLNAKENKQIDKLLENKKITEQEAEKLKKAVNALPTVIEKYPLPDLHLRLTAALAKTYSLLKILLIASNSYIFYTIAQTPLSGNMVKSLKVEKGWFLILIYSLIVIFSFIQFTASIYLTRGSRISRRLIAWVWLFDLTLLPMALLTHNYMYLLGAAGAGGYSLWVLYFRENAGRYINFKTQSITNRRRYIYAVLFIFCLIFGLFFVNSNVKYKYKSTSTFTKTYSRIFSGIRNNCSNLKNIAVIAGTQEKETAELAKKLLNGLKKNFPSLNFKYLRFGKSFPEGEIKFDEYIFVNKTEIVKPEQTPEPALPSAVLKKFRIPASQAVPEPTEAISFNVVLESDFNCHHYSSGGSYLNLNSGSNINGNILVASDISNCSLDEALKKCSEEILKHLIKEFKKTHTLYTPLDIPVFLSPELKKVSLKNFKFLQNSWCIGNFRNALFDNFSIYLFPLENNREKQKETIIGNLEKNGWNYLAKENHNHIMAFSKSKNDFSTPAVRIYLPPKPDSQTVLNEPKFTSNYGRFVYASENLHHFTREEAEKLSKYDFTTYVHCVSLSRLNPLEIHRIFQKIYNDPESDFNTLKILYDRTSQKNIAEKLGNERDELLIKMGNVLKRQIGKPTFGGQLLELASLIIKQNKYTLEKHPALAGFQDKIIKAKLNYNAESKLYATEKIIIPGTKTPAVIEISGFGSNKDICLCVVSCEKQENKENKVKFSTGILLSPQKQGCMDRNSFTIQAPKNITGRYIIFTFSKNYVGSASFGELFSGESLLSRIHPSNLGIRYDYISDKDQFELKAVFKTK